MTTEDNSACPECGDKTRSVIQCAIECRERNAMRAKAISLMQDIADDDAHGKYGRQAREAIALLNAVSQS